MAGIVQRAFSYQVTGRPTDPPARVPVGARVVGYSPQPGSLPIIDETLNSNGRFGSGSTDTPITVVAQEYSVTGTSTVATTDFNAFEIRFLDWTEEIVSFNKNFTQASEDTIFYTSDSVITETNQTTVNGYPGFVFGASSYQFNSGTWNPERIYDRLTSQAIDSPEKSQTEYVTSVDGVNFNITGGEEIRMGVSFDGANTVWTGGDWSIQTGGDLANVTVANSPYDLEIDVLPADDTITNVSGDTIRMFTSQSPGLTLDGGTWVNAGVGVPISATITLINGASITNNLSPGSLTIVQSVAVKVTVVDSLGAPIQGAKIFLEEDPGGTDIIPYGVTDVNGEVNTTYGGSTPQNVTGFVRKGTSSPVYKASPISGTITSGGFDQTITLVVDE